MFGGKVPRAGTASRSTSEPHEVPTWRGDQGPRPRAPARQSADARRCPVIWGGRVPALSATPVRMAHRGASPTGKLGRLALALRSHTPRTGRSARGAKRRPFDASRVQRPFASCAVRPCLPSAIEGATMKRGAVPKRILTVREFREVQSVGHAEIPRCRCRACVACVAG